MSPLFHPSSHWPTEILSAEVQEEMREAANNLVKHFHKPEQEVSNRSPLQTTAWKGQRVTLATVCQRHTGQWVTALHWPLCECYSGHCVSVTRHLVTLTGLQGGEVGHCPQCVVRASLTWAYGYIDNMYSMHHRCAAIKTNHQPNTFKA